MNKTIKIEMSVVDHPEITGLVLIAKPGPDGVTVFSTEIGGVVTELPNTSNPQTKAAFDSLFSMTMLAIYASASSEVL